MLKVSISVVAIEYHLMVQVGFWSFDNGFTGNVVIFSVGSSWSSHTDTFLVLGEGPTDDINGSISTADKKFNINFSKWKTKFCFEFALL